MSIERDLQRFKEIGEDRRPDLTEHIQYGDLGRSREDGLQIPIKIVDLPEFVYDPRDKGGVGKAGEGQPEPGQPVGEPEDGDDGDEEGEDGEAGDGEGEHSYYEMDPEEFARELDEELDLDLDPKGKEVIEETEGRYNEMQQTGPNSLLDVDEMFQRGLKRRMATLFDENYLRELLKVSGVGPARAYTHARNQNIPVSKNKLEALYDDISQDEAGKYSSLDEFEDEVERRTQAELVRDEGIDTVEFRKDDQRFRRAEVEKERQKNVVVINIRDVSGSMGEQKQDLVERVFSPLDWYLTGKYDRAEFHYIAHDSSAFEVDREEFFGIQSGGGTRISTAYELAQELLDEHYPWSEWNRYVFAAGDGENKRNDTTDNVIPLMEEMNVNQHAYVETQPGDGSKRRYAKHADEVKDHFESNEHKTGNVTVTTVESKQDVIDSVKKILDNA